jgi:hypothetical protein
MRFPIIFLSFVYFLFFISGCGPSFPSLHPDRNESEFYIRSSIPPGKKLAIAFEDTRTAREAAYSPGLYTKDTSDINILGRFEDNLSLKLYESGLFLSIEKLPLETRRDFVSFRTTEERLNYLGNVTSADLLLIGQIIHLVTGYKAKGFSSPTILTRGTLKYQLIELSDCRPLFSGIVDRYNEIPQPSTACLLADIFMSKGAARQNEKEVSEDLYRNLISKMGRFSFEEPQYPDSIYFDMLANFRDQKVSDISRYSLYKNLMIGNFVLGEIMLMMPIFKSEAQNFSYATAGLCYLNTVLFQELHSGQLRFYPILLGSALGFGAGWFSTENDKSRNVVVPVTTISGCILGVLWGNKYGLLEKEKPCNGGLKRCAK